MAYDGALPEFDKGSLLDLFLGVAVREILI